MDVTVASKEFVAEDIVALELVAAGGTLPAFSAGSHVDVELPGGIVRQYSLCNDPSEQHRYRIAVLLEREGRGGSRAVHESVQVGQQIRISQPRNHFELVPARRSLLFAGGIGITPILCMAQRLRSADLAFRLHYCTRSRERTAFLQEILDSSFADNVQFHWDDGGAEQLLAIDEILHDLDEGTHLYVCGPEGFMSFVLEAAKRHGWPSANIHYEYFAGKTIDTSSDGAFEVKIASTGQIIAVPAEKSVATALSDAGVSIPVSCEQGVCGTCVTRILDGVPDHRDMFFTDEEKALNDQFTPCCSRSLSNQLVLDL